MTEIAQRELRNQIGDVLRRAEAGERFTVTVSGRPVAELGPVSEPKPPVSPERLREIFERAPVDAGWALEVQEMREEDRHNAVDIWGD